MELSFTFVYAANCYWGFITAMGYLIRRKVKYSKEFKGQAALLSMVVTESLVNISANNNENQERAYYLPMSGGFVRQMRKKR